MDAIHGAFEALHDYLERENYEGWEYDDLLASPLINGMTRWGLYPRIAAVQIAKRFPFNLRRVLGVPKLPSTKAWGFVVKGYLYHYMATGYEGNLETVRRGLEWLMDERSPGYDGYCWGNDFDFASRLGFFPKTLPTVVWTSHIQAAFDLAWKVLGDPRYLEVVTSVADFVASDLRHIAEDEDGYCIEYAPGIGGIVHNSNLLGVVSLLRACQHTQNSAHLDIARQALNWSVHKMNADGSWYYGVPEMQHWIDNYHTGYNLDCLVEARELMGEDWVSQDTIDRTYSFWRRHFFGSDGSPNFYHNRRYPHDIQATAQAIESLSKYSVYEAEALDWAAQVCEWALAHMQKENGSFRYRIYRYRTNNLETIHWGQATMLSSMGHLLYYAALKNGTAARPLIRATVPTSTD